MCPNTCFSRKTSSLSRYIVKGVWLCCTLLEEKVEWFYKVTLVASSLKMRVVALGLWSITRQRPKLRELTKILKA